jgi:hypothetical protein
MLDEKVDHKRGSAKKRCDQDPPPFQKRREVTSACRKHTQLPRQSAQQIDGHGDIV